MKFIEGNHRAILLQMCDIQHKVIQRSSGLLAQFQKWGGHNLGFNRPEDSHPKPWETDPLPGRAVGKWLSSSRFQGKEPLGARGTRPKQKAPRQGQGHHRDLTRAVPSRAVRVGLQVPTTPNQQSHGCTIPALERACGTAPSKALGAGML